MTYIYVDYRKHMIGLFSLFDLSILAGLIKRMQETYPDHPIIESGEWRLTPQDAARETQPQKS